MTVFSDLGGSTEGHRQGFLWVTGDKKLRFPTSSILIITPTLSLPTDLGLGESSTVASTTISSPFKGESNMQY